MTKVNIFEEATRKGLRFQYKGNISVEDLWVLDVEELDSLYRNLMEQQKQNEGVSLISEKKEDKTLQLKIDLVRHIVEKKLNEAEARKNEAERIAKRKMVLEIVADKQQETLRDMSLDELHDVLDKLS